MMLPIITHPNPILRQKARELTREDILNPKFKKLMADMAETMLKKDGFGLAAPQINQSIRLVTVNNNGEIAVFLNPKILKKSWRKNIAEEGCLSIPNVFLPIKRHSTITLEFLNLAGDKQILKTKDLLARVLQHEIDHLDGILFIDKAEKIN
ncbi:peptide deformylase [Candidatus Kuenenbacteria bacterium CG10_big_fil_rev_8_21_14_0_10_36_11]|uniref:Peptide deformylase n=1 Tax=Candidatus Kuenenbacteria bacterium CG10_big_fil_rev_8_21_14_0_10_36_11 TaxID=1974618 RepID=A0A2M6WA74_9BACT|nr:MAG: peptide deformylase [Candidatus Kuenenbacteria bacterium CG10_big_fil_rev_8_21_14_0_10_36_11]